MSADSLDLTFDQTVEDFVALSSFMVRGSPLARRPRWVVRLAYPAVMAAATTIWLAFFAPAKTPQAVVQKLNAEIGAAVNSTAYKARLQTLDMQPVTSTPQQLAGYLTADLAKWARVVKDAGIKPE